MLRHALIWESCKLRGLCKLPPERFSSSAKETFLRSLALSAKAAALVLSQYYIPDHLNDPLRIRSLCQCLALSEAIRAKKEDE